MGLFHVLNSGLTIVWLFICSLTVEPIAFLNFLGFQLFMTAQQTGLYAVICYQTFPDSIQSSTVDKSSDYHNRNDDNTRSYHNHSIRDNDIGVVDCDQLGNNKLAEVKVQQLMSELSMYLSLVHILPSIMAHIFLGAWGDKHGRKINILIGITGLIINTLPFVILFEYKSMPLWVLMITGFISGSTGYIGIIMISSFAYLADITVKKENLTVRMVIYSIIVSVSGVFGSLLAALCLTYLRLSYIGMIMIGLLTVSFFYSFVRLKQISPTVMKKFMIAKEDGQTFIKDVELAKSIPNGGENAKLSDKVKTGNMDKDNICNKVNVTFRQRVDKYLKELNLFIKQKIYNGLKETGHLLCEVWRTYSKPRQSRHRMYLLLMVVTFFMNLISNMAMHVNGMYVFRSPISWKGQDLAYWKATTNILHTSGNFFGVLILKKLLKCSETTIILIALLSDIFHNVLMGFANSGWMLYVSVSVGSLGPLFMPTIKSFITQTVDGDEVGKAFIMFGLAHDVGQALSSVGSNAIYRATVSFFPGFLFLFCAFILCLAFCIVLFVHLDSRRQMKSNIFSESNEQIKNMAIESVIEQVE